MKPKKFLLHVVIVVLFITVFSVTASAETVSGLRSLCGQGNYISIVYDVDSAKGVLDICVSGAKNDISLGLYNGDNNYNYRLKSGEKAAIPLNMGDGEYALKVRIYLEETLMEVLWKTTLTVNLECEQAPYLSPSKIVNWTDDMPLTEMAKSIAAENDPRKAALDICRFISLRYSYDTSGVVPPVGYIPELAAVYEKNTGICYDYAALYAAMCRSVGIPVKLIMGYSSYFPKDAYHAWCRVYIDGEWLLVDPVYNMARGGAFLDAGKTVELRQY